MFRRYRLLFCSIIFIAGAVLAMLVPAGNGKWFYDPVGYALIGGMMLCFALWFGISALQGGSPKASVAQAMAASAMLGLGFIFAGIWLFGEKQRFAKLDVVPATATITRFDTGRMRSANHVDYAYTVTETGAIYRGSDTVNSGQSSMAMRKGAEWPVLYLREDPSVSRIVEPHYGDTWLLRGLFVGLGAYFLLWVPLRIWRRRPWHIG